ncbi:unnamed protein product, partial [Tuber aestivum]
MDIHAYSTKDTYLINSKRRFTMPTDSGGIQALSMSNKEAQFVVALCTIYTAFTFMVGWDLVRVLIIAFTGEIHDGRLGKVFKLWKFGSLNIAMAMLKYIEEMMLYLRKTPKEKRQRKNRGEANRGQDVKVPDAEITDAGIPDAEISDADIPGVGHLCLAIVLVVVFFGFYLMDFAIGAIVGAKIIVGNVAPANANKVFYPDINTLERQGDTTGLLRVKSMRIDSAFRAIAATESPDPQARRKRVTIEMADSQDGQTASPLSNLNYSYNVTGVDMGLQSDPKLVLRVKGACRTEYTWLVNTTEEGDTYRLWGGNETYHIKPDAQPTTPPWLAFFHDEKQILDRSPNLSYAIIANTAGRYSYTASRDPWYSTRETQANDTPPYQVLPNRPVLNCWETKTWHLGGKDVDSWRLRARRRALNSLPNLKLHELWSDTVFPREFELPRIVSLGSALGISSLRTASYALDPFCVIDAGSASMRGDFKRLVLGSWVSSQNVLRDTTTYNHGNLVNLAHG